MIKNVSQLFQRLKKSPGKQAYNAQETHNTDHIITTTGTIIYHMAYLGYYNILSDDGIQYTPFNLQQFPSVLRNNMRIQFTLQTFPQVQSIHQTGTASRLINVHQLSN